MPHFDNSMQWYEHQRQTDLEARDASWKMLGPERGAFVDAMALAARCLDEVSDTAPIRDLVTKRKIAIAHHAFNLLWSAWDAALAGRYVAATGSWRSVADAYEFLLALHANPQLADSIGRTKVDVHTARRTVRDALEKLNPGQGKAWFQKREKAAKEFQAYSHISLESTNSGLAIEVDGDEKVALLRPGGMVSRLTLRQIALSLAASAHEFLIGLVTVFRGIPSVAALWSEVGLDMSQSHLERVGTEIASLHPPQGEIETLLLYQSVHNALTKSAGVESGGI